MIVRPATEADKGPWAAMRAELWPDAGPAYHAEDLAGVYLAGDPDTVAFVAEDAEGRLSGFVEAGLRHDYVEGCETSPVVFVEGLFVAAAARGTGAGRALVEAVAAWGRAKKCAELASNALLENAASHAFHEALGFAETERVVFFRRML